MPPAGGDEGGGEEGGVAIGAPCHVPLRDASVPARDAWGSALTAVYHRRPRAAEQLRSWHKMCVDIRTVAAHRWEFSMNDLYLTDAHQVADATALIASYGETAAVEAATRADRSAMIGNHITFCRWRQIERLIDVMAATQAIGSIH